MSLIPPSGPVQQQNPLENASKISRIFSWFGRGIGHITAALSKLAAAISNAVKGCFGKAAAPPAGSNPIKEGEKPAVDPLKGRIEIVVEDPNQGKINRVKNQVLPPPPIVLPIPQQRFVPSATKQDNSSPSAARDEASDLQSKRSDSDSQVERIGSYKVLNVPDDGNCFYYCLIIGLWQNKRDSLDKDTLEIFEKNKIFDKLKPSYNELEKAELAKLLTPLARKLRLQAITVIETKLEKAGFIHRNSNAPPMPLLEPHELEAAEMYKQGVLSEIDEYNIKINKTIAEIEGTIDLLFAENSVLHRAGIENQQSELEELRKLLIDTKDSEVAMEIFLELAKSSNRVYADTVEIKALSEICEVNIMVTDNRDSQLDFTFGSNENLPYIHVERINQNHFMYGSLS